MSLTFSISNRCDKCNHKEYESFNVTHNLARMADEAGMYKCLWRSEEYGYNKASEIIKTLSVGIESMEREPRRYKDFNPDNGWGDYGRLLEFAKQVLAECIKNPDYSIESSR